MHAGGDGRAIACNVLLQSYQLGNGAETYFNEDG